MVIGNAIKSLRSEGPGTPREYVLNNAINVAKLIMWLKDWSLRDDEDYPIPCDPEAIEHLDVETGREILERIERYEDELSARKNRPRLAGR